MTPKQQEKHFKKLIDKLRKIQISKAGDYANTDVLSNFKLAGSEPIV